MFERVRTFTEKVSDTVDRVAAALSPEWATKRKVWRNALREASYRNARRTRTDNTVGVSGHPDAINELTYDRFEMLERGRELERNNQIAAAILDRYVENIVGSGFIIRPKTQSLEWNEKAAKLWSEFSECPDVRGLDDFTGVLKLLVRSEARDGDVGVIKLDKGKHSGKLQLIEADQIKSPAGEQRVDARMVDGVQLGSRGEPVVFHVIDEDKSFDRRRETRQGVVATKPIPAEKFLFLAARKRIGQTRGITSFAQSAWIFEQLDKVVEAVTITARMAACFGVIIKRPGGFPGMSQVTGGSGDSYRNMNMEPGMWKYLEYGEEISTLSPSQPHQDLVEFITLLTRFLGLAFSLPLELVLLDFSKTTYSSARAALLQAQRAFRSVQMYYINRFCKPIYRWKVDEWVAKGELDDVEDKYDLDVIPPGWSWVDPQKEVEADLLAVDAGFLTLSDVITSRGNATPEDVFRRRKEEIDKLRELDIVPARSNRSRDPVDPEQAAETPGDAENDPNQEKSSLKDDDVVSED